MAKKPKISVVLTPDARELVREQPISVFMTHGRYFSCISVEQNGYFLDMKLPFENSRGKHVYDVSIPMHFIMYLLSSEATRALGFDTKAAEPAAPADET